MWHKVGNFILRNRFLILGIITLLTVFFGYYAATNLKTENKYGILLPKDSPTTRNYKHFKDMFGEDGGTLVFAIQTDSLYTKNNFRKWKELGDSILQYDGVQSVISEATLFTLRNNQATSTFDIQRIFSDTTYKEKSIDSIKREIRHNPIYNNLLYNDSTHVSLMMVSIDEKYLSDNKKSGVVLNIEKVAKSYEKYFGKFHYAGLPHLRVVLAKRIQQEMYIFIGFSLLVTSLLMYIFFRSFRAVMICLSVVIIAVVWSLGSISFIGYRLSVLMALIPPLMIVIGVPNSIYIMTKFHQEVREHGNKIKALSRVIEKIGTATFMTNFTTAIGFLTFVFTNSEKLYEFGLSASMNIMMIFMLSLCIIPIFASLSKPPKERHLKHLDRKFATGLIRTILYLIQYKRKWIYGVTIGLIVISIIGASKIRATGNITGDLPENDQILQDVKFLEKNFGGAIPFEVMIDYKEKGRLFKNSTLEKVDEVQTALFHDSLFSKSISLVDLIKVVNMAYYNNDSTQFKIISNKDKLRLKKYMDNFNMANPNGNSFSMKELVDTAQTTLRVRLQMKDLGSYEVADQVDRVRLQIDSILNPDKQEIERLYAGIIKGRKDYIDSLIYTYTGVYNSLTAELSKGNSDLQYQFDSDPELVKKYTGKKDFYPSLRAAIDNEYYDVTLTGTSVVASEGTKYMVNNLFSSIIFAVIVISILMALLFRSWRMVIISMAPNIIPMIVTGGIMGWLGIPLKPSTLLVFSIALGISVDDTIHYLAKYRQELKQMKWDLKECVLIAIRESALGMFYTSIVLFCGFSVFMLSQFGGTKALGLLISITLLIAMITNLLVLPSLLLSLQHKLITRSFKEPYFEAYSEESDIDWSELQLSTDEDLDEDDEIFKKNKPDK